MPHTFVFDLTGQTFGRLTVLGYTGHRQWRCVCVCGKERVAFGHYLRRGVSTSCGCGNRYRSHGMRKSPEWKIWSGMRQRCLNRNHTFFNRYGGRGISICDRWSSFENFYADMGPRPSPEHQIDRIDNDGNYEPCNCRWVNKKEQSGNRSISRRFVINGESRSLASLAQERGMLPGTLHDRLSYGWSIERALSTPVRKKRSSNANN